MCFASPGFWKYLKWEETVGQRNNPEIRGWPHSKIGLGKKYPPTRRCKTKNITQYNSDCSFFCCSLSSMRNTGFLSTRKNEDNFISSQLPPKTWTREGAIIPTWLNAEGDHQNGAKPAEGINTTQDRWEEYTFPPPKKPKQPNKKPKKPTKTKQPQKINQNQTIQGESTTRQSLFSEMKHLSMQTIFCLSENWGNFIVWVTEEKLHRISGEKIHHNLKTFLGAIFKGISTCMKLPSSHSPKPKLFPMPFTLHNVLNSPVLKSLSQLCQCIPFMICCSQPLRQP